MAGRAPRTGPAASRVRRGYTIRDQVALRRLSGYAVSADGSGIALRITSARPGSNRLDSTIWLMDGDGAGLRKLKGSGREGNPVFGPDGSLFYLTGPRGKERQVVRLAPGADAPEAVTASPIDIDTFVLSRDGSSVAFSAMVFPGTGPDTLAVTAARLKEHDAQPQTGRVYDQLMVRHWDEWRDGRRRHVFVQSVAGGPAVDVMPDMDADSPVKPFGGNEHYTFTPDGTGVVFTARDAGREEAWSTDLDLFLAPGNASESPRKLTTENPATDTDPSFSPDGRTLAYLAMDRPGFESDKQTVLLRAWPDGATRRLTDHWDRSVDCLAWSADGRTLYLNAQDTGQRGLFAIDVESGRVTSLVGRGHVGQPFAQGGRIYYVNASLAGPGDLYVLEDGHERRLTRLNERPLRGVALGEAEQFSFPGWNGETVHGHVLKPANFDPAKRYPVAFIIHGGPQGSFSNDWSYRWNPQVFAGAGYAAVFIDFHGSTGYGQGFTDSISGDWGGKPLEDLQQGWAYALARYPFLDPDRAAALGASFGGFMVNYIAGVWNEPWKALVSHDGNLDEHFAYYATEELWFPEWEHGGVPWEHRAEYAKHNPVDHIAEWRVPTLVIHGQLDYRVSDIEGLAMFTALQRRGIPSRLLYFPDENHWVLKPQNSVQWHDTVLGWLAQWLGAEGPTDA